MGRRLAPAQELSSLLPAEEGHLLRGRRLPTVAPDAIEACLERVAPLYRASLATRREHGFLAYAPGHGEGYVLEADAVGTHNAISWHWEHPHATVAFSFHTHPSPEGALVPSGIDAVGALIRGDHLLYILTMDGRLAGWRFRAGHPHARAVERATRTLDDAKRFDHAYVRFLYDAFEALQPRLMEPVYAARLVLEGEDGLRVERAEPTRPFLTAWEARRA